MLDWLLVAVGVTGAWTLGFLWRKLVRLLTTPASTLVHFSPKGGCTDAVVAELNKARREVFVLAYSFTSRPIAQALVGAKDRGVKVEVILDHSNEKEAHTELLFLLQGGLAVVIDPHHPIAHNKIMLIDGHVVITGSFNFTNQAEHENAENLLILRGQRELARQYRADFEVHKAHSRAASPQAHPAAHRRAA
jgi:phosphatidylserine/phosphatidylglycerophosphate/cardiolipin synthase-like enzyme